MLAAPSPLSADICAETCLAGPVTTTWNASNSFFAAARVAARSDRAPASARIFSLASAVQTVAARAVSGALARSAASARAARRVVGKVALPSRGCWPRKGERHAEQAHFLRACGEGREEHTPAHTSPRRATCRPRGATALADDVNAAPGRGISLQQAARHAERRPLAHALVRGPILATSERAPAGAPPPIQRGARAITSQGARTAGDSRRGR